MTFKNQNKRHQVVGHGADSKPSYEIFGIIPSFVKSEHPERFPFQKWFIKDPAKIRARKENFRKASKKVKMDKEGKIKTEQVYNAKYSPEAIRTNRKCKRKECYEEYMYIGEDKPVEEEDIAKGVTTIDELKKTLKILEHDYKSGLIDKNQFRYRIYLMHMAIMSMSDDEAKNGEFAKAKNRKLAQQLLREALERNGIKVKRWKISSRYYRPQRKIVDKKGVDTYKEVSADKIIWLDSKGRIVPRHRAKYYLYKEPKTSGDVMHNNSILTHLRKEGIATDKIEEEIIPIKELKQKTKKLKEKAKKSKKKKSKRVLKKGFTLSPETIETTSISDDYTPFELTLKNTIDQIAKEKLTPSEIEPVIEEIIDNQIIVASTDDEAIKRLHAIYKVIKKSNLPESIKEKLENKIKLDAMSKGWDLNQIIY